MSPSSRSNSRDNGPRAGDPHHPVSPSTFTKVEVLPGIGITGGFVGTSGGSGVEPIGGSWTTGVFGSTTEIGAGDVGRLPPPHAENAIALPIRRLTPNAGGRRRDIVLFYRSYQKGA